MHIFRIPSYEIINICNVKRAITFFYIDRSVLNFQSPIKGPVNPYDPHNYDDYYADEYGGYGGAHDNRRGGGGGGGGGGGRRDRDGGDRFNNRGPPPRSGPMGYVNI